MTSIAKDVAAKASVALVALAMVFTMFAPVTQAQSTEDLQQMINDLLAQVASLQGQIGQGGAPAAAAGVCPYTWTRDLSTGSTGMDVMKLQQLLNSDPDTRVAMDGQVGGPGMETEYFGPATAAAVSKMQVKYRAEVLSPAGLVNPTGFFGPSSRAKANSLCVAAPVEDDTDDDMTDDEDEMDDEDMTDDEDEMDDMELGGEASLDNFEIDDADETDVEEGAEDAPVAVMTIEFADGDAEISRIDIDLDAPATAAYPWDAFETFSLWVDGDKIAEVAADDEDEYLDEDDYTLRFSDVGVIAAEDEEVEITVAATLQNNLDGDEIGTWEVNGEAVRFFDADGVATTEEGGTITGENASFTIEEEGEDDELSSSIASNDPEATDIIVDEDSTTDDVTIMIFDLEAEGNDIELDRLVVRIDTPSATTTDIIDDAYLVIDGQTFDAEAISTDYNGSAGDDLTAGKSEFVDETDGARFGVWYLFDIDGDVTIAEDEEMSVEVVVDLKAQDPNGATAGNNYSNGQKISASLGNTEQGFWQAEGGDDLTNSSPDQFTGSAAGEEHTLVAAGIVLPVDGVDFETSTQGQDDTTGIFELSFEVTAVEGDFYIRDLATLGSSATTGVAYTIDTPTGVTPTTTGNGVLDSTADETQAGGVFIVREGETETFTLTVTVDPQAPLTTGQYRVTLTGVNWSENENGFYVTAGDDGDLYVPSPEQDFRSPYLNINL